MALDFLFHFSGGSQEVTVLYLAIDKGFLHGMKERKRQSLKHLTICSDHPDR